MKDKSIVEKVYELIAAKIQTGSLLPNQKITEESIANELDISRTPAREALIKLASEDLLIKIPRKGFYIKSFSKKEKMEKYEIMGALDGLVGCLAATRLTDEDIYRLQELYELAEVAIKFKNYNKYQSLVDEFHDLYTQKCGNDSLIALVRAQLFNFVPNKYMSEDPDIFFKLLENLNKDHQDLIVCFKNRDAAGAERVLRNHWKTDENFI